MDCFTATLHTLHRFSIYYLAFAKKVARPHFSNTLLKMSSARNGEEKEEKSNNKHRQKTILLSFIRTSTTEWAKRKR